MIAHFFVVMLSSLVLFILNQILRFCLSRLSFFSSYSESRSLRARPLSHLLIKSNSWRQARGKERDQSVLTYFFIGSRWMIKGKALPTHLHLSDGAQIGYPLTHLHVWEWFVLGIELELVLIGACNLRLISTFWSVNTVQFQTHSFYFMFYGGMTRASGH